MRIKTLAGLLAASSLIMASPALSASAPIPAAKARASAPVAEQSEILDSGFMGAALVFALGLVVGYLLHTVLKNDDDEVPASP
jgi:hypothetical protein